MWEFDMTLLDTRKHRRISFHYDTWHLTLSCHVTLCRLWLWHSTKNKWRHKAWNSSSLVLHSCKLCATLFWCVFLLMQNLLCQRNESVAYGSNSEGNEKGNRCSQLFLVSRHFCLPRQGRFQQNKGRNQICNGQRKKNTQPDLYMCLWCEQ